jgi:hypothetical protein
MSTEDIEGVSTTAGINLFASDATEKAIAAASKLVAFGASQVDVADAIAGFGFTGGDAWLIAVAARVG